MSAKSRLFSYLRYERKSVILLFILSLCFVISQLAQPFLLGRALDMAKDNNESGYVTLLIIATVLVILGVITGYLFEVIVGNISLNITKKIRDEVYTKLNNMAVKDFDRMAYGDMLQLEIRDTENMFTALFSIFKTLVQGVFTIVITIIMMVMVNWILALAVTFLTPLSILMSRFVARFSHKHFQKQAKLQSEINAISLETLNNIDIITSNNYELGIKKTFINKSEELRKEGVVALFSASWVNPSTRLVNNTIYVIIGISGIIMMSHNAALAGVFAIMSIGRLSSFLTYTTQYSKPFNEVSSVISEFETGKSSFKRIHDFLNKDNDIDEGTTEIEEINSIEFNHVYFSYDKNKKLIEDFSLKINKGDKIAIVGPTGAGKSTLINLLMRFYDVDRGSILMNGIDIRDIKKSSLRKNMGMVLQETWIFKGTIKDNVSYLAKEAKQDEIIRACKESHADDFIDNLPQRYESEVSAFSGLSQGERQMIAISRVMMSNPQLVILDEATSSIDTRNEKLIGDAFDKMMKEKTSIVIAHRLSTIKSADVILMIKDGSIKEIGSHKELMAKQGLYYQMYTSQYR